MTSKGKYKVVSGLKKSDDDDNEELGRGGLLLLYVLRP